MKRFIQFFTRLLLVFFVFFSSDFSVFGQTQNKGEEEVIEVEHEPIALLEEKKEEEPLFCCTLYMEQNAVFEGGMDNFYEIVNNQMRFSETMKEGRVFIQFVVDTTGKMTDFKVVKSISEENDKEVLQIMNLINEYYTWKPAEKRGKKVKVRMCLPIVFKREEKVKSNAERVYKR